MASLTKECGDKVGVFEHTWVIDDDPINNLICETLLLRSGFTAHVQSFLSARKALEALHQQSHPQFPQVLFLDINMPDMDGWSFLHELRALTLSQSPQIVILSSSVNQEDIERANQWQEVAGYVSKPLDINKLRRLPEDLGLAYPSVATEPRPSHN
ncbi:MAG: response regulator [Candidatus Sericytochromatia bacterium]